MKTLVIGYGNTLRGDDGVGYRVAVAVADWQQPEIRAIACHQLTPELAADMAQCDRVIFVDASLPGTRTEVAVQPLLLSVTTTLDTHHSNPKGLLYLTATLYSRRPEAHHVLLPTVAMHFGETLSAVAQAGMTAALEQIKLLCDR